MRSQDDHNKRKGPPEAWRTDRCPARHGGPMGSGWHAVEPLPELARQGGRGQPRLHLDAGQRGAQHPPVAFASRMLKALGVSTNFDQTSSLLEDRDDTTITIASRFDGITGTRPSDEEQRPGPPGNRRAGGGLPQAPRTAARLVSRPHVEPPSPAAIGVDYKQMYKWYNGVEPSGAAMQRLYEFASTVPGGLEILLGRSYQMTFLKD